LINHLDRFCFDLSKEIIFDDMQKNVINFFVLEVFQNLFSLRLWYFFV
jgi:hypothetical protein